MTIQNTIYPALTIDQLCEEFSRGCKPPERWRVGLEHEQFAFAAESGALLSYAGEPGIRNFLRTMADNYGWEEVLEAGNVIALHRNGCNITLEPGGQVEISGSPYTAIADVVREHQQCQREVEETGERLGIGFFSAGMHPRMTRADIQWMPKERYVIMRNYLPTKGKLALDMMGRSSGAQVNLDYSDEADMVTKMRVALGFGPFITALFASSGILEGEKTGFASYRSHIWTMTDPDRCGIPSFIFGKEMGFARYAEYLLDVPMFFIERDGKKINLAGKSFRAFNEGRLPENKYYRPEINDWKLHLTTAFPQVRLKSYLEIRDADSVAPPLLYALPAFWAGLLYDSEALAQAASFINGWNAEDCRRFFADAGRHGIHASVPKKDALIRDVAPQIIALASRGLNRLPNQKEGLAYLDLLQDRLEMAGSSGSAQTHQRV